MRPTGFIAGTKEPNVADLAAYSAYCSLRMTGTKLVDFNDFPRSQKWAENVKSIIPNYEKCIGGGIDATKEYFKRNSKMDWDN